MSASGMWVLVLTSLWVQTVRLAWALPAAASIGTPSPVHVIPLADASVCVGDCQHDCRVTIDNLLTMVNVALGDTNLAACVAGDADGDQRIAINELVTAVSNALNGCAATCTTPTPTPTSVSTPSATPTTCPDMTGMWSGSLDGDNLGSWTAGLTQVGINVTGTATITFPFLGKCSNSNKFCRANFPCANGGTCVIPYRPSTDVIGTNDCGVVDLGFRDVIGFIGHVSGNVAGGTYTDPDFGIGKWVGMRQTN